MEEAYYDERFGDPLFEADDDAENERDRQDRDAWLLDVARALQAVGR